MSQTFTRLFVSSSIAFASFLASAHPSAAAAATPSLEVGVVAGSAGTLVSFPVTLHTTGEGIAGAQIDIAFDPSTPVAPTSANRPSCHPNPAILKDGTAFTFQPTACMHTGIQLHRDARYRHLPFQRGSDSGRLRAVHL